MRLETVVTIADDHFPHVIPRKALNSFLKVIKPTKIIHLGDSWDLEVISHWNHQDLMKEMGLRHIRETLNKEASGLRDMLSREADLCGGSLKELIYFEGNHEAWIKQYQASYGNAGEPLTLEGFLKPREVGITKIVPQGEHLKIGHLGYLHGDNYTGGNLPNIAKRILDDYECSMVFGHFHSVCLTPKSSALKAHEKKKAICIGTMGSLNPGYIKNKPNQWQNAFHVAYFMPNGTFSDYVVYVINDRFVWNGKIYAS